MYTDPDTDADPGGVDPDPDPNFKKLSKKNTRIRIHKKHMQSARQKIIL